MGKTISVHVAFDATALVEAKATVTASEAQYLNRASLRLSKDLIYVLPKQWVHVEKLAQPFNGYDNFKAVYVVGMDIAGHPIEIQSIGYNSLKTTFYGTDAEPKELELVESKGRQVIKQQGTNVFKGERPPFKVTEDLHPYVARDFAFKLVKRSDCFIPALKQINKVWTYFLDDDGKVAGEFKLINLYEPATIPAQIDWKDLKGFENLSQIFDL